MIAIYCAITITYAAPPVQAAPPLRQRIVFLTSLDFSALPDWGGLVEYYSTYPQKLERVFRRSLEPYVYESAVVHRATRFELARELANPRNVAVIFLGHAGDGIVDHAGRDITSVLANIHPGMRFLGVVGCKAQAIIERLRVDGALGGSSELLVHSFSKPVDAGVGLKETLARGLEILRSPGIASGFRPSGPLCARREFFPFEVTRTGGSAPVSIWLGKALVATLPALAPGVERARSFWVPAGLDLKIRVQTGERPDARTHEALGVLELSSAAYDGEWRVFAKPDGTPIGAGEFVYRYSGPREPVAKPVLLPEFQCPSLAHAPEKAPSKWAAFQGI
ncbi:MAG: hypothetical protein IT285_00020 [Bdellovibrionales bacterium]|nr:hypothetical protein [Bdellovibrionales bacterium]